MYCLASLRFFVVLSGKVPGGLERKTNKMMQRDLQRAREAWKSDFLKYENSDGLYAEFHSNRHLFITSLERVGITPKMAQTLARHSDVRLTLGIYTHVGINDQAAAIESLPAPPVALASVAVDEWASATGTDGHTPGSKKVPTVVPRGAKNGAIRLAPKSRTDLHRRGLRRVAERAPPGSPEVSNGCHDTHRFAPFRIALHRRGGRKKRSTPKWARTTNLRFRRPMLYPIELWVRETDDCLHKFCRNRGSLRIVGDDGHDGSLRWAAPGVGGRGNRGVILTIRRGRCQAVVGRPWGDDRPSASQRN